MNFRNLCSFTLSLHYLCYPTDSKRKGKASTILTLCTLNILHFVRRLAYSLAAWARSSFALELETQWIFKRFSFVLSLSSLILHSTFSFANPSQYIPKLRPQCCFFLCLFFSFLVRLTVWSGERCVADCTNVFTRGHWSFVVLVPPIAIEIGPPKKMPECILCTLCTFFICSRRWV